MFLSIQASLADLARIRKFVRDAAIECGVIENQIGDLQLAVDEVVTNIIEHGYQGKSGNIEIEIIPSKPDFIVNLRDHAEVFNILDYEEVDTRSPLQRAKAGGYGVHLTHQAMDRIKHDVTEEGGNEFTMIKYGVIPE